MADNSLRTIFDKYVDSAGMLSVTAFVKAMGKVDDSLTEDSLITLFEAVDYDNNKFVDFDEFSYMYFNRRKLGHKTEVEYKAQKDTLHKRRTTQARELLETAQKEKLEKHLKEFKEEQRRKEQLKIDNMYSRIKNKAVPQVVKRDFDSRNEGILESLAKDFGYPLPMMLDLKSGDKVLVIKKGLGLASQSWCSGKFHDHKGVFPTNILDNKAIYKELHAKAAHYHERKERLRELQKEKDRREIELEMKECTFKPKLKLQKNKTVNLTAEIIEPFTEEDMEDFGDQFADEASGFRPHPLVVAEGQFVNILKRECGRNKEWNFAELGVQRGFFPNHCIDAHAHVHAMHSNHEHTKKQIQKYRAQRDKEFKKDHPFQPNINSSRLSRILPNNYKKSRELREAKRRLQNRKDMDKELTFVPATYLPGDSSISEYWEAPNKVNGNGRSQYEILFGQNQAAEETSLFRQSELGNVAHTQVEVFHKIPKVVVIREFKCSRPGAMAQILVPMFGLDHPPGLELSVGERVRVIQPWIGKDGAWGMGKVASTTGVFPMSCITKAAGPGKGKAKGKKKHGKLKTALKRTGNGTNSSRKTNKVKFVKPNRISPVRPLNKQKSNGPTSPRNKKINKKASLTRSPVKVQGRHRKQNEEPKTGQTSRSLLKSSSSKRFSIPQAATGTKGVRLTTEEKKRFKALRVRVKESLFKQKNNERRPHKLSVGPKPHEQKNVIMHRPDFIAWLISNDLIETENRRIVDYFFDSIAGDGPTITFRLVKKSLSDVKLSLKKKTLAW
jgi:hypothetical protein